MTRLIDALARRLGEQTGETVVRHETHISWILLSGAIAWKLKKPVQLPFVDFRDIAARRRFCEAEVRLNRRLAPSLYLGVLAVTGSDEAPQLSDPPATATQATATQADGATPPVIDYLVSMRRFPAGALFAERLAAGTLDATTVEQLARRLARFDADAEIQTDPALAGAVVSEALKVTAQLTAIAQSQTHGLSPLAIAKLEQWLQAEGQRLAPVFDARLRAGRVRDVHGDLHLANAVVLDGEVTAFDCLEFNDAMRRIDVIGDVAFLAMDLDAHGSPALAHRLVDAWCEAADDHAGVAVLPYHQLYRALVRCLVAALGPADGDGRTAGRYLATAQRLAAAAARPPRLLVTHGLSGSGKSWSAQRFVESDGALRLRSDVERKRLAGIGPLDDSAAAGLAIYTTEWSARTYARLEALARTVIGAGRTAVVDAAFLKRAERDRFAAIAASLGVAFGIIDCSADVATLRERIRSRARAGDDPSEATTAVLDRQLGSVEPLDASEKGRIVRPGP